MLVIHAATPGEAQQQIIKYLWARYSALKLVGDTLRDAYVGPDPIRALDGR